MDVHILPEFRSVPADKETDLHLLIRLEAPTDAGAAERIPAHVALVLDRSASMDGEKLQHAEEAAVSFMRWLTREDFLSVVAFHDEVSLLVPHQQLTEKNVVECEIRRISAQGVTNLSGGWLKGLREIRQNSVAGHIHRVVLMTDGEANRGVTDVGQLADIAERHLAMNISTTTVGFGKDFNEDMLHSIADAGGGHFYYVDEPEGLADAFREEFRGLSRLVGQNLELALHVTEGIKITRILSDCPGEERANSVTARFGDLHAQDLKSFLVSLRVPAGFSSERADIATVTVEYDSLVGEMEPFAAREILSLDFSEQSEPEPEVRHEIWMAHGMVLRSAAMDALTGSISLRGRIDELRDHADSLKDVHLPTQRLKEEAEQLRRLADSLESAQADRGALRKALAHERFNAARRSTAYQPGVREVEGDFNPDRPEHLLDVVEALERMMRTQGYLQELIDRAELILKELGDNALEHGCGDRPGAEAHAHCYVATKYVRITVEDDGPGFDFDATLEQEREEVAGPEKRGRGLLLIANAADQVRHSDHARHVEAIIRREGLAVSTRVPDRSELNYVGDIVVMTLKGHIDAHTFTRVDQMLGELSDAGWSRIVVDLSNVEYLSSAGAGVFMARLSMLQAQGGNMVMASPTAPVRDVLDLIGLSQLFEIFDEVQSAIEFLS